MNKKCPVKITINCYANYGFCCSHILCKLKIQIRFVRINTKRGVTMLISLELIVEAMEAYGVRVSMSQQREFSFRKVQMLTPDGVESMSEDILYVCEPKMIRRLTKAQLRDRCFVVRARPGYDDLPRPGMNVITYNEQYSIGDVINCLLMLFDRVNSLEFHMRLAVRARSGYGPLIKVARKMIPDATIIVVDSAYNVIASSRDRNSGNAYVDMILRQGYYDKDSLQQMAEAGYFNANDKYLEPVLSTPPNVCGDPVILRSYHANGMFFSFAGCYFPGRMPTKLEYKMFQFFTEQLHVYFKETNFYDNSIPLRQQMISDLLNYDGSAPELVRDRARHLRLPEQASFRLGYAAFDDSSSLLANHLVLQLRCWSNVPNYGIFQHKSSVIILFQDWHDYPLSDQLTFKEKWNDMLEILNKSGARLGVSLLFTELGKLRMGYNQAKSALKIGRGLNPDALEYHYSKYYLHDMLSYYNSKFSLDDITVRYLEQLSDEKGYANSNLLLLYHYLSTERNISLTAKQVHMHRNSVIYRLQKIQDILNLDMDDPDVRMRLMITFKIMQMKGQLPAMDPPPVEGERGDHVTLVE